MVPFNLIQSPPALKAALGVRDWMWWVCPSVKVHLQTVILLLDRFRTLM